MKIKISILIILGIWALGFANTASAQNTSETNSTEYRLLEPLPLGEGNSQVETVTTASYLPGLFRLIIGIAGVLAVVKIIWGGIQYMSTDAWSGKNDAKTTIQNALLGLLLAMSAWLIVYTINPDLVRFDLNIPAQQIAETQIPTNLPPIGTPPPSSCVNCITIAVPAKTAAQNGCIGTGLCRVDSSLNAKLILLQGKEPELFVTEAYPPTVPHNDPCHRGGTCVDARLDPARTLTPQEIKRFIDNADSAGLNGTIFEATSQQRVNAIVGVGVPASRVIVTEGNGEHFHVK